MSGMSVQIRSWPAAREIPVLEAGVVHLWSASLVAAPSRVQSLRQTLTADEISRAERFHFQKDREHFIVARGLLRLILSRYLDLEPPELRFRYGAYGKPALAVCPADEILHFNLAHSNGLALYAITQGCEIGVDLEYVREDFPGFEIAERFFSRGEVAMLRELPPRRRQEAFFTFWTLKEACIKANGQGLSLGLDRFDVSALVSGSEGPHPCGGWLLQRLVPAPGYIGAVAVKGVNFAAASRGRFDASV